MKYRITTTCAAALLALGLAACDDGEEAGGEVAAEESAADEAAGTEEPAGEETEAEDGDEGEADPTAIGRPDEVPDEWPEQLPVHTDGSVGRTEVIEHDDGTVRVELQYSLSQSTDEALAYLESLADEGWDVQADEGSEGTSSFVDGNLEGHGWEVTVSFQNNRYTWGANQRE